MARRVTGCAYTLKKTTVFRRAPYLIEVKVMVAEMERPSNKNRSEANQLNQFSSTISMLTLFGTLMRINCLSARSSAAMSISRLCTRISQ